MTTMKVDLAQTVRLGEIFQVPGDGFVVELYWDGEVHLFDKQGLQYRILQKKQQGLNCDVEESALIQLNNFDDSFAM